MTSAALQSEQLGKRYGRGVWALRGCSLDLPAGAVIGLVGPNGAGKSTLLQLVVGLLEPTEGSLRIHGQAERGQSRQSLARVGYVAQDHPLFPGFTVGEMFHVGRNLNPSWDQAFAEARIAALGIAPHRRVKQLSGGEQAQVALTIALAKRAPLLVLDEPVASLDPVARVEFMQTLMAEVADAELTVLVASHVIGELQRICDWIIVLNHGSVQIVGAVDELLAGHRLLTGPRAAAGDVPGVVHRRDSDRHASMVVRLDPGHPTLHPRWHSAPVGLEEIVLAHLQQAETPPGSDGAEGPPLLRDAAGRAALR